MYDFIYLKQHKHHHSESKRFFKIHLNDLAIFRYLFQLVLLAHRTGPFPGRRSDRYLKTSDASPENFDADCHDDEMMKHSFGPGFPSID